MLVNIILFTVYCCVCLLLFFTGEKLYNLQTSTMTTTFSLAQTTEMRKSIEKYSKNFTRKTSKPVNNKLYLNISTVSKIRYGGISFGFKHVGALFYIRGGEQSGSWLSAHSNCTIKQSCTEHHEVLVLDIKGLFKNDFSHFACG